MSSPDSPRRLPTASVLDNLREAIDEAAQRCGLSERDRQIYGTWIFGFVCWCLRTPPNCVTQDRIEAFRRNLQQDSSADPLDQQRALDALAFFFGEVNVDELDIRTSRPGLKGADEELPFAYYNQMNPPDETSLSPVQDAADELQTGSGEMSMRSIHPDWEKSSS